MNDTWLGTSMKLLLGVIVNSRRWCMRCCNDFLKHCSTIWAKVVNRNRNARNPQQFFSFENLFQYSHGKMRIHQICTETLFLIWEWWEKFHSHMKIIWDFLLYWIVNSNWWEWWELYHSHMRLVRFPVRMLWTISLSDEILWNHMRTLMAKKFSTQKNCWGFQIGLFILTLLLSDCESLKPHDEGHCNIPIPPHSRALSHSL